MTLGMSAFGFAVCVIIIIVCVIFDKTRGADYSRVAIAITGILAMMCLFFLLANLLVVTGAWAN